MVAMWVSLWDMVGLAWSVVGGEGLRMGREGMVFVGCSARDGRRSGLVYERCGESEALAGIIGALALALLRCTLCIAR